MQEELKYSMRKKLWVAIFSRKLDVHKKNMNEKKIKIYKIQLKFFRLLKPVKAA